MGSPRPKDRESNGDVGLVGLDWRAAGGMFREGVALGLLAAVAYAAFLVLLRQAQAHMGSALALAVVCASATGVLVPLALFEGQPLGVPDLETAAVLVGYALSAQVIGWSLIARGLPRVAVSRAGLLLLLQPALAFVWDILLFARPTGVEELGGAALALGAIYLGTVGGTPARGRSR